MASVVISRPATDAAPCNAARRLGRVDDALGHHVDVLARLRVEAEAVGILLEDLADHDRAILASIKGDLARRPRERFADNVHAMLLVLIRSADALEHLGGAQERDATAWQDAFLDSRIGTSDAGGVVMSSSMNPAILLLTIARLAGGNSGNGLRNQ